jgi:uncharacterized protein YdhG (YjbR/CyaY superfamily)
MAAPTPASVEEYLAGFPQPAQEVLRGLRAAILRGAPGAEEAIRYQMAAFRLGGTWLNLGGWAKHAGLYPVHAFDELEDEAAPYRTTSSTVQLPYAGPVPYDLVERLAAAIAASG